MTLVIERSYDDFPGLERLDYPKYRYAEWRRTDMDQLVNEGKTGMYKEQCAEAEQKRERDIAMTYIKKRHGLVEEKKSAYRPVKGGRRKY